MPHYRRILLLSSIFIASLSRLCEGTSCLVCSSLISNEHCNEKGIVRECRPFEVCESKVSSFGTRLLVTKRCTPRRFCNVRCKGETCRTCCKSDRCNADLATRLPSAISHAISLRNSPNRSGNQKLEQCDGFRLAGVAVRCLRLKTGNTAGTTCLFWCPRQDYVLVGKSRLTCVMTDKGAQWSGQTPDCVPKTAARNPNPGVCEPIEYDTKMLEMSCNNGYNFRSACTFRCKDGYYMVNENTYKMIRSNARKSVCWRGTSIPTVWTRPPPHCMSKKCPVFVEEDISTVQCTNWIRVGSVCEFQCFPGYTRIGPSKVQCMDHDPEGNIAAWNDTTPECEPRECPELNISEDILLQTCTDENFYRSECEFVCVAGYYMAASGYQDPSPENKQSSKCRVSKVDEEMFWSPSPPICIKKTCIEIPFIENGFMECTENNEYSSKCSFSCGDAFLLIGDEILTCIDGTGGNRQFGIWDGTIPWCRPKVCDPPIYDTENTEMFCSNNFSYQSKCTYQCKSAYYMTESDGITFVPSGNLEIQCVINEERAITWSQSSPVCHLKSCDELRDPEDGIVSCSDSNNLKSRCSFICFLGFELEGQSILTCQDAGSYVPKQTWNHEIPQCKAKPCPEVIYEKTTTNISCTEDLSYRSICTFTCKLGYYMLSPSIDEVISSSIMVCRLDELENLEWSAPVPQCILKICEPLGDLDNGTVECSDGLNHRSECRYICNSGYETDGPDILTCMDDGYNTKLGVWDTTPPSCIKRSCAPLDVDLMTTGFNCEDDFRYESKCDFYCMEGHYMTDGNVVVDATSTVCGVMDDEMIWIGDLPQCKIKSCPEIPDPERGLLRCNNGFNFGSGCMSLCSPGFYLDGQNIIQCQDNGINDPFGIWSHTIPACKKRLCPSRSEDLNATIIEECDDGYLFESKCNYSCIEGFYMKVDQTVTIRNKMQIICGVRGTDMEWSSELPSCNIKTCLHQKIPENGEASCTDNNTFGSVCSFTCRKGFDLKGSKTSQCVNGVGNTPTAIWDQESPVCERRSCEDISYDNTSLTMSCTNGMKFESICKLECQIGYYAVDEDDGSFISRPNTTCLVDDDNQLFWTNKPPRCLKKTCDVQRILDNGEMSCTDDEWYLSQCSFECYPGFQLIGAVESVCIDMEPYTKHAQWSETIPICERRNCSRVDYGESVMTADCTNSNQFESVCVFECNFGRYMTWNGHNDIIDYADTTCTVKSGDMVWSDYTPYCLLQTCPEPRIPEDGEITCDIDYYDVHSTCIFSCALFRELRGPSAIYCNADYRNTPEGHWNSTFPTCELRSCPELNIDPTAIIENCENFYKYGSKCTFTCNIGHYVPTINRTSDGESTRAECGIDGSVMTWSGRPPVCEIKTCHELQAPVNGELECSDGFNWDTRCVFSCERGYLLIGESVLRCDDDNLEGPAGIWSGVEPICEERSCTSLQYDVETQDVKCSFGVEYGSVCAITCKIGHYLTAKNGLDLIDNATAVCDVHPTDNTEVAWDYDEPKCIIKTCRRPKPLRDGFVICQNGRTYGEKCNYRCKRGFDMIGLATTSCKDDGQNKPFGVWGKDAPVCEPKSCPSLVYNQDTTNFSCTDGWKYRSICTFSCNKGFFVTESDGRTVVESGSKATTCGLGRGEGMAWTDDVPTCLTKHCLAIRSQRNMTMECTNKFRFNSTCTFRCDPPLKQTGPSVMTCLDDEESLFSGKWDGKFWRIGCQRR